jgi:hypothetical protein
MTRYAEVILEARFAARYFLFADPDLVRVSTKGYNFPYVQ